MYSRSFFIIFPLNFWPDTLSRFDWWVCSLHLFIPCWVWWLMLRGSCVWCRRYLATCGFILILDLGGFRISGFVRIRSRLRPIRVCRYTGSPGCVFMPGSDHSCLRSLSQSLHTYPDSRFWLLPWLAIVVPGAPRIGMVIQHLFFGLIKFQNYSQKHTYNLKSFPVNANFVIN